MFKLLTNLYRNYIQVFEVIFYFILNGFLYGYLYKLINLGIFIG